MDQNILADGYDLEYLRKQNILQDRGMNALKVLNTPEQLGKEINNVG